MSGDDFSALPPHLRPNMPAVFADASTRDEVASRWEDLWREGRTPWDVGGPSPALVEALTEHSHLIPSLSDANASPSSSSSSSSQDPLQGQQKPGRPRIRALVPGSGRGHDVLLLANFGYDVVAVELSPTADEEAKKNERAAKERGYLITGAGKITWVVGDFFEVDILRQDGFDLVFDYTFLCAISPELRPKWSQRIAESLTPIGRVICLEFPSTKPTHLPGPPWGAPSELYLALLTHPGENLPYDKGGMPVMENLNEKADAGLKRLALIKPKATSQGPLSYDDAGNVLDWVSIWAPPSQRQSSAAKV